MEITAAAHFANPDRLWGIHGKDRVLGFVVQDHEKQTEVLYEVHRDGLVRRTHPLNMPNPSFHKPGRAWFAAAFVPEDAVFCGSYKPSIR